MKNNQNRMILSPSQLIVRFSLCLIGLLVSVVGLAQTNVVNKDVEIFIPEGAKMFVSGSYTDNSTSEIERLTIGGELEIQGDFINNATSSGTTVSDKDFVMGKIKFSGSGEQKITGNDSVKFRVLEIDKPAGSLVLDNISLVKDTLMLTLGDLELSGGKLCLLEETNSSSGVVSYSSIKTGDAKVSTSGGGFLQVEKSVVNAGDNTTDIMGIGLGITVKDGDFNNILVRRTHGALSNVANGYAVLRNYSLVCGEQVDIEGVYFQYRADELDDPGLDPNELAIYMSSDSLQTWKRLGGSKSGDTFIYSGDIALEAGVNYGFAIASKECDVKPLIGYNASASNKYDAFTRDIDNYNFDICEGEVLEIEPYDSLGTTLYYAEFTYPADSVVSKFKIAVEEEVVGDFEVLARSTAGCESNSQFILNSKPSPVVEINASPTTTICHGQEVEFSHPGTDDEGGTMSNPTYVWDFGDAGITSDGDPDQAVRHWTYDVYGHKSIAVKVTSEHQCTVSDTVSYIIAPIPEFDFSFVDVCREETAQFNVVIADTITVNNDEGFGTRRSFIWTYGDGKKDTTENLFNAPKSFEHLYTGIDGTLPVKLEMIFESSQCRDSVMHNIFIKPKPVAIFEPQFKSVHDPDVCVGEIVTFNNTTYISDASALSYSWSFGDANSSDERTPLHQYAAKGEYEANLLVTSDVHGCTDEVAHDLTVFPDPTGGFTIIDTDICLDEEAEFINQTTILDDTPNLTYLWEFGDGTTSTDFEPEYLYTVPGIYQVELTRTSKNGCQNKISRTHNVHPEPVADFVIVDACVNDPAIFVSSSSILYDEISLYEWTFHDGTAEGEEVSHIYTDDTERDVTLYIESSFGCDATLTQSITPAKRPTFNMAPIVTCESEFEIDPEEGTDKYLPTGSTFEWTNSDGLILSNSQTVLVDQGGLYTVSISGPSPLQCHNEEVVSIFVFDPVDLGDDVTFCKEGSLEAELTHPMASSGSISETYVWFQNDSELIGESGQSLFVDEAGTYRMEVEYAVSGVGSCEVTDEVNVQIDPEFVVAVGDEQLCAGQTVDLDAGVSGADYEWYDLSDGSPIGTDQIVSISETGRYRVEVSKASCFAAAESSVNFYKSAVVDFYNPESGVCVGEDIVFTNYSFVTEPSSSITDYEWDFGDGSPVSTDQHPTKSYVSDGTYTVSLSVSTSEGCSYVQSHDVEIDAFPVPDFTITDVCVGENIDLQAPVIAGATYSWDYGNGLTGTGVSSAITYTTAGDYDVELAITNSSGCQSSIMKTVHINALPIIELSESLVTCGDQIALDAKNAGSTYEWKNDLDEVISIDQTISIADDGDYSLLVYSPAGCSAEKNFSISLNSAVTVDLGDDRLVCGSETIDAGFFAGATYSWSTGESTQQIEVTSSGTYSVQIIDGNGCPGAASVVLDFEELPNVNLGADIVQCEGETITLDAGNPGSSYTWSTGASTQSIEVSTSGTYNVEVENVAGCKVEDEISIVINDVPSVDFTYVGDCRGDLGEFTNLSSIDSGEDMSYSWSFGDGTHSAQAAPKKIYSTARAYSVELTGISENGCTNSKTQSVKINPLPSANFAISDGCEGEALVVQNKSAIAGLSELSYSWSFGDGHFSTEEHPEHTIGESGTYTVQLTAMSEEGCQSDINKSLEILESPVLDFGDDIYTCNTSVLLDAENTGSTYRWSNNTTGQTLTVVNEGLYTVAVTHSSGCKLEEEIYVSFRNGEQPDLGDDLVACGQTLLDPKISDVFYDWSTGENTETITVDQSGTYGLTTISTDLCINSDVVEVQINEVPEIDLGNEIVDCDGTSVSLDAEHSEAIDYLWSTGANTPRIEVHEAGIYSVELITSLGCAFIEEVEVLFDPIPEIDLEDEMAACDELLLDAGRDGDTYAWSTGATDRTIEVEASGIYSVLVGNDHGCTNYQEVNVVINTSPTIDLGSDQTLCYGETLTLTSGDEENDHIWSDFSTASHLEVGSAGVYSVSVTNEEGCTATDEVEIDISTAFKVSLGEDRIACSDSDLALDAGLESMVYEWYSDQGFIADSQGITADGFGSYWVKVTDQFGCSESDTISIIETDKKIKAGFLSSSIGDRGDTIQFAQLSEPDPTAFYWDFGDGAISNLENPQHQYLREGEFSVMLVASNEVCTDTLTKELTIRFARTIPEEEVALAKYTDFVKASVFPNPIETLTKFDIELTSPSDITIGIFDMLGVLQYHTMVHSSDENILFDLSDYPSGVYFMRASVGKKTKLIRLIKK